MIKTTFSNFDGAIHITNIQNDNHVIVYKQYCSQVVCQYKTAGKKITSAVYGDNHLLFSYDNNDGNLCAIDSNNKVRILDFSDEYSDIAAQKYFGASQNSFLLRGRRRIDSEIEEFIYVLETGTVIAYVPLISESFTDIEYLDDHKILELTHHIVDKEDDDEMEYQILVWNINDYQERMKISQQEKKLQKYIGIYSMEDFWSCQISSRELSSGMKFPFFSNFFYHWPMSISLNSEGNIVFYCEDIAGMVIGDEVGDAVYFFELPPIARNAISYYFDGKKAELYTLTDKSIYVYRIDQDKSQIEEVNQYYNKTDRRESLQNNFKFKRLFYECLISAEVKLLYKCDM